jgi:hypothetical protein
MTLEIEICDKKKELTQRQLFTLPFILSNPSISGASKESGVSEKQIWEWMNQENFRKELYRQRSIIISLVTNNLQQSSLRASETLIDLMINSKKESIKLKAAETLLNLTLKFTQVFDLEERINKLERERNL